MEQCISDDSEGDQTQSKSQSLGPEQLMGAADDLKPMPDFPLVLTTGGDDRLTLSEETGTNKYFSSPYVPQDVHFRGSCTCNSPTQVGYDAA